MLDQPITYRIEKAVHEYKKRTALTPRMLLVGWREYKELLDVVWPGPVEDPPQVATYGSMRVRMLGCEHALSVTAVGE